jgi:oxygen-independent coproporphyrinogen-3 oxidase
MVRNFQGYSTHAGLDLLAFGPSSISQVGGSFAQNERKLVDWQAAVREGRPAVARGVTRSADDHLRADVISTVMCRGELDFRQFERDYQFAFRAYFGDEFQRLEPLVDDGLLVWTENGFEATAEGLLFLRAIAMAFDAYLDRDQGASSRKFSRIV